MVLPKDSFQNTVQKDVVKNWKMFMKNMETSINTIEKGIKEASEMADVCTSEWCEATEHLIDELSNQIFSISEPRWADQKDSQKIRDLRRRVHDLYADYKQVYSKA